MKKIFLVIFLYLLIFSPVFAVNIGTYKTETDYGLIDGFKWNFFNKKDQPFMQLKSEIKEEQIKLEKEKAKKMNDDEEIQLYKFMLNDTIAF